MDGEPSYIFKFGNCRFIFGTETGQEVASLEWVGIRWDGLECSGREIFQIFLRKIRFPGKWHSGTQTSRCCLIFINPVVYIDRVRLKTPYKNIKVNHLSFLYKFPTIKAGNKKRAKLLSFPKTYAKCNIWYFSKGGWRLLEHDKGQEKERKSWNKPTLLLFKLHTLA